MLSIAALWVLPYLLQVAHSLPYLTSDMSFNFPPNATKGYLDTTVADISVHFNDTMLLEYSMPNTTGQVMVFQTCYSSAKASRASIYSTQSASYDNTGTLLWNVGNGNNGNYTGLNFCNLYMANYTIIGCQWGPWGLLKFGQDTGALAYSQFFKISGPNNKTKSTLISSNATTTATTTKVTATARNVTCPPSGIPASPIYTTTAVVEQIPRMASNLSFPTG